MFHVRLVKIRSGEAKKLREAGTPVIKDKSCLVINPRRQDVGVKRHWVEFAVTAGAIRQAFNECGVKEVSTDCVTLLRIPHQIRLGSGTVLIFVPCLQCRNTGHIRHDCRIPRYLKCQAFGHENGDCTRSYTRAVGRSTEGDFYELLMDDDEAENAVLSPETPVVFLQKSGDEGQEEEVETPQKPTAGVMDATCDPDAGDTV
ncbi:hypothetical protein HPB50_013252 [Hyalomma asiaticum]|uniref:Uncharacterized protein n=1 Tax=Hyalomma asiaticum TaxID=266040 RepID=A0ACB7RUI3_HYAAI|nr:hypothetical protein HPB50_013252 [Hyalomma asiaticum]